MFSKAPPEFLKRTLTGSRGGGPRAATAWACAGRPWGYHTEFLLLSQRTRRRLDSCRRTGLSLPKRDRSFVGKRKMGCRAHWIDPQTNRRLDYTKIIPEANIELSASPGIAGIRKTGSSKRNPFCTIRTARTNRHSAMLWSVGLKSYIRAHCRQPHSSCYMRPRNDDEPKLEKL